MTPLIIHSVLAIVGIRLGLLCVMTWQRLRLGHRVAGTPASGRERVFLVALPLFALLMAAMVVNSGITVIGLLGNPAP
jgi:hypothetical protein